MTRVIDFEEFFEYVIGRVVEKHVRYVVYGVTRCVGVGKITTAHHIFLFYTLKIGLARQVRNGRQANLSVRPVLGHPLGQIFAAVHNTLLTVYAADFDAAQVVGARHHVQLQIYSVVKHVESRFNFGDRLVA
ncbi:16 kDa protein [Orgyia leucostigma nucleopolyhedrovirus]|uniref:16 kDa protein n=1 Tax=Orgyia leucostigma nucleopolyhedrovirus TaxID=490711 RepID=B0FDR4_9ABAC|nr:16 kDa protein [Orgyia leucostigma nucleopolyhedrovirus]ABY65772.1 16 kDa protein [Orgyia leucostigma nucleopolyhedrovirus]